MPSQKIDTIQWFAEIIKGTPGIYLWLASSGQVITGRPISPAEYYLLISGERTAKAAPSTEGLLALKDVKIRMAENVSAFDNALVDLNLIVAWGAYDPAKSSPG